METDFFAAVASSWTTEAQKRVNLLPELLQLARADDYGGLKKAFDSKC
jgi:hypothetical protein